MLYENGLGLPPASFGDLLRIEPATVPRWDPTIIVTDRVRQSPALDVLGYRAPARYVSPEIFYRDPQPLLVRGGSFAIVAEREGIVPGSTYLLGNYGWNQLFASIERFETLADHEVLVAANNHPESHYHWIFQCLAPILVAQAEGLGSRFNILVPPLARIQRESLDLAGVDAARMIELPATAAALANRGIYSNLTSGGFAFVPHPAIIAALGALSQGIPESRFAGRKIFISRADATKRRMVNEAELGQALAAAGFDIVQCGGLSLADQIALFRDALLIVAQHGAALTNLLFAADAADGPMVIELHQENYLNQAFLKISQAKRLRYWAVVNPMVGAGTDGRHDSTWAADVPAIVKLVNGLDG